MQLDPILELFYNSLPNKPYAADNPSSGIEIYSLKEAVKKRHFQFNTPFEFRWFAFDIDRATGYVDWIDRDVPIPNIIITNPSTHKNSGRAHLLYGLETPVIKKPIIKGTCYNKNARTTPIKFSKFITKAMTIKLDADRNYPALLCKNPLNKCWITKIGTSALYNMESLSIGLEYQKDTKKPSETINDSCYLFNMLKDWSYSEFRNCNYDEELFAKSCYKKADELTCNSYLSERRINSIINSVINWVTDNFTKEEFIEICRRRGKAGNIKSIQVRQDKKEKRNIEIVNYKINNPQTTYRELAQIFNVSLSTISSIPELKTEYEHFI